MLQPNSAQLCCLFTLLIKQHCHLQACFSFIHQNMLVLEIIQVTQIVTTYIRTVRRIIKGCLKNTSVYISDKRLCVDFNISVFCANRRPRNATNLILNLLVLQYPLLQTNEQSAQEFTSNTRIIPTKPRNVSFMIYTFGFTLFW